METDDIADKTPSPWIPMSNPGDVALLGKLQEEQNELGAIIARCLIQGFFAYDPETNKLNSLAVEDEIADVMAVCDLVIGRFSLDMVHMSKRKERKIQYIRTWIDALDKQWPPPTGGLI